MTTVCMLVSFAVTMQGRRKQNERGVGIAHVHNCVLNPLGTKERSIKHGKLPFNILA